MMIWFVQTMRRFWLGLLISSSAADIICDYICRRFQCPFTALELSTAFTA